MKIVLLVSSMGSGGAERVAATLVNAWAARGDSVTLVATFSGRGNCFYPLSDKVRFVYLADHDLHRNASNQRGPLGRLRRFSALRSLIRSSEADVVVSFLTNVNVATILASTGLRIPVIACEHNDPSADGRPALWRLLCRLVYPRASAVTVLTDNVVEPFRAMVPGVARIAVVPNPLPDELFLLRRPSADPGARRRLISVGRLHRQKNYGLLIDIFASLAPEFPDWDLWIWGDGPERAQLATQITQRSMTERIVLAGVTPSPWEEMARSDAFVMTSRFEGFGLALAESMALGVPSVAFDCPSGPRQITRDGQDALLVPRGDKNAMTNALRRLLADEHLRAELGRKGTLSIRERYSVQAVTRIWDDLFASVGVGSAPHARTPSEGGALAHAAPPSMDIQSAALGFSQDPKGHE
jgi:GalNAc-alpha-(1->4)-GalNAc-alpha-(1->3)-diNAcBac-PP-undecaprenol alpha-1,4-N-acetyl-D-galactosaminyltransferase